MKVILTKEQVANELNILGEYEKAYKVQSSKVKRYHKQMLIKGILQ
jgi:hypothetical protein